MAELIKLQCCVCNKEFERNKADHLYSLKRGRKRVCCSLDCARQSRSKPEATRKKTGLKSKEYCPNCKELGIKIMHTSVNGSGHRLRRKECMLCDHKFTTYEILSEEYNEYFKGSRDPKCFECRHNIGKVCSLGLPEYMTKEAYDCIHA